MHVPLMGTVPADAADMESSAAVTIADPGLLAVATPAVLTVMTP